MEKSVWVLLGSFVLMLIVSAWIWLSWDQLGSSQQKGFRLEQLLGQQIDKPQPSIPSHKSEKLPILPRSESIQTLKKRWLEVEKSDLQLGLTTITVTNNAHHYLIRVPVSNADDQQNIRIKVTPSHIEVSGQTSLMDYAQKKVIGRSQFFKSFDTDEPVNPNRQVRTWDGTTLTISIPKQAKAHERASAQSVLLHMQKQLEQSRSAIKHHQ